MVPYLPKAAARESSLVSKLRPPMNNFPSSDIFVIATKKWKQLKKKVSPQILKTEKGPFVGEKPSTRTVGLAAMRK